MGELTLFDVGPLDLPAVAEVHVSAFGRSALTALGREAVRRYYEWLLAGPHDAVFLGVRRGESLAGFCCAGVYRGATHGFLHANRVYLVGRVLRQPGLVLNPLFRDRLTGGVRALVRRYTGRATPATHAPVEPPGDKPFGILSIATDPRFQRQGAGRLLLEGAKTSAVARGFSRMALMVHPDNQAAVRFYETNGWERSPTDETWRGLMTRKL